MIAVLLVLVAATADDPTPAPPPPQAHLVLDGAITAGTGAGWLALSLGHSSIADPSCPCTRSSLNDLDEPQPGWHFGPGEALANTAVGVTVGGALLSLALTVPDRHAFFNDGLIMAESVMIAGFITQGIKTAVARPYPFLYRPHNPAQDGDAINYESFPSGHTAVPMAAATSFAYLYGRRHPHSRLRYVFWTVGPMLALGGGLFQMSTGNHFATDVIAGALIGSSVGVVNPWLHTL